MYTVLNEITIFIGVGHIVADSPELRDYVITVRLITALLDLVVNPTATTTLIRKVLLLVKEMRRPGEKPTCTAAIKEILFLVQDLLEHPVASVAMDAKLTMTHLTGTHKIEFI
jgi:hypothetical protein